MDAIGALRQTKRWRLWVRGTQIEVLAFAATLAFGFLAVDHVPRAVAVTVLLIGGASILVGFCMTVASLPVLMLQHSSMFNGRQSAVMRAFLKDVLGLRKPPPLKELSWPPPMRRP